ncbi:hypothetical protein [Lentzea californiensis]|uniref:hypothetical protein n=1 Tax=Lentzea californiensis TaxID=438851 RepID=UPI0021665A45|nr:hypothetical protein [Lentzea californiensis]MCR3753735.1 Photosystem I reaction center subunit IX / PsaJ [Lentzea californiensis]
MRATDATQFLSTAAVLFTIFLTVAAGALISGLPRHPADLVDDPDPGIEQGFARAIRSMLVDLVVLNALGVLLPFTCLFVGVFTRLPTWLVIVCFAYTVMVFLTNLAAVLMVKFAPQLYDKAMRRRGPGPSEGYL